MHQDENEEDEINLRELFITIKNGIGTIFFITLFIVFMITLYLYFYNPIYSSSVTIALDNENQNKLQNILPGELFSNSKNEGKLQLAEVTLQSKKFISTIIDRVNVDREFFVKSNFKKNEVGEFSDIKIDIKYKDKSLYRKFFEIVPLTKDSFLLKVDTDTIKYNQIHKYNKKIDNEFFSLRVIKTNGKNPFINSLENKIIDYFDNEIVTDLIKPRYYFRFFDRDYQVDNILNNMSVSKLSDNILKIVYNDNMPVQTKEIVQEIAKSYIDYNLVNKTSELEQTLGFLDKQIIDIKSSLKNRGDELKKYQQKSASAIISVGEDILETLDKKEEIVEKISLQIQEINKFKLTLEGGVLSTVSLISAGIDTSSLQLLMESYRTNGEKIESLRFQQNNIGKAVTSNMQINLLINELKERELSIQELLINFTQEHPQVVEERLKLDNLRNKIHATIMANIEKLEKSRAIAKSTILDNMNMVKNNLQNRLKLLRSNIREKKALLQSIPEKQIINENLKRKFALSEEMYTFLLQKKIEVEISKASIIANTKILEDAYVSNSPIKPKKKMILIISFVVGIIVGIFFIFIRTVSNTKIQNISDIEKMTSTPIYGTLPLNNNDRFFKEALRNIRTNLQFIIPENKSCMNMLISSTVSGEGKTVVSHGLSDVIAQTDKKVLVMDLDLRKPKLYKRLKRSNKIGMSNYLTSDIELDDIIQSINPNLDFFPAGSIPPNPSELLMSKRFGETIRRLEERYDYIIFDSAPIGTVIDANMLLKYADILLLVVKSNMAERVYLENFNRMVEEKRVKSTGIILNGVKFSKSKDYGYGYGYDYDYGE